MSFRNVCIKAVIALIAVFALAPSIAFADTGLEAGSAKYITESDMGNVDLRLSYGSCDSLPLFLVCDAFENVIDADSYVYNDAINYDVYLKKPGGKFKKVISSDYLDEEFYQELDSVDGYDFDEDDDLEFHFRIRGLKPSTKYVVKVDCRTEKLGITRSVTKSFKTLAKPITGKQIKKNGGTYSWKKAKKVSGYIVQYRKQVYVGKNEYGTKVYERRYFAKTVKKSQISLGGNITVVRVIPYEKHDGYYYADKCDVRKSLSKIVKKFKYVDDEEYYG